MRRLFFRSHLAAVLSFFVLCASFVDVSFAAGRKGSSGAAARSGSSDAKIWAETDQLINDQKLLAALDKTKEILERAKASRDGRLWTEAQVRSTQLQIGLSGFETAVRDLKDQPWPVDPAGRVLLNLFYAHALMQYQQVYGWEIRSREKTVSTEKVDLKAWTTVQIGSEISRAFDDIMKNAPALNEPSPDFFDLYVQKNTYPKGIRPVLRDLAVYMAIHHLANSQYWTPKEMSEVYRVNAKKLALETRTTRIAAADPSKHPLEKIASWLGEHREFHKKAGRPEASLNAQYELLETLHAALNEPRDRKTIRDALKTLQGSHRNLAWWARGQAMLSGFIRAEDRPGRLIDARNEALAGMKAFPESYGGKLCLVIVQEIERPNYSIMNMTSDNSGRRSILINYKNIGKLYFRAYPYDVEARLKQSRNSGDILSLEELRKEFQQGTTKPSFEWSADLQPTPDFAQHRKFVIPPFKKNGAYAVLMSSRPDFSGSNDVVQAARIIISDLVMTTVNGADVETRVVSGEKGTSIKGAEVSLYRFTWNTVPVLIETKKTDENGYVLFGEPQKTKNEYWNYFIVARKDGQIALELDRIYFGKESGPTAASASFVYTDRFIYRPQQKVLWKVAAYNGADYRAGKFATEESGVELSVRLLDPNNQQVELRKVKVGEFGTASGEFSIPTGRPLGNWTVEVVGKNPGRSYVRVEEYKRPTFEASLKDSLQPMRLNRKMKLQGDAVYLFGLPVSQGSVTWQVQRQEVVPVWWMWQSWGRGYSRSEQSETVASGVSPLKVDGSFDVEFTPEADERKAEKTPGLTYNFTVEANVTDEGGETRTAVRSYRLGFVSVEAALNWENAYFKTEQPISIAVTLNSLDGKAKSGEGKYQIFKLKQPAKTSLPAELERDAATIATDIYGGGSTSEADLERFPTADDKKRARWETAFTWQSIASQWTDESELSGGSLSHDAKGIALIKLKSIDEPGVYRLQYETKDDFGTPYKVSRPFLVVSSKPTLAVPLAFFNEKSTVEVGSKAKFFIHSGLVNQSFQVETFRGGKRIARRTWTSGKDPSFFEIPITKDDRGGFTIAVSGVRDHQFMRLEATTNVPWSDKFLTLDFSTFRDRIRPGTKETFKVTVRNADKSAVASGTAEVLAYMYDRSLDLFGTRSYPGVESLYSHRAGAPAMNLSLAAQPGFYWTGSFLPGAQPQYISDDSLKFHSNYGIGGPGRRGHRFYGESDMMMKDQAAPMAAAAPSERQQASNMAGKLAQTKEESKSRDKGSGAGAPAAGESPVQLRSNFSETAFFKPHLISGKDGSVSFEFIVPDSVTTWNVLAHALTKDMHGGSVSKDTKSVKELMVRPYVPRFLREGDEARLKMTVNNASTSTLTGTLSFDIEDPDTGKSVAAEFGLKTNDLKASFAVAKNGSQTVGFSLKAPKKVGTYAFRVVATSGNLSDGELRPFPVLPSRMHLAQSRFAALKNKDKKILEFKDLAKGDDPTLLNEKMVVTLDTQLFYGVLQSLPYLVNSPYECIESVFNRFLASGVISSVFKKYPSVEKMAKQMSSRKTVFEKFDEADANRRMTLEESPWLEMAKGGSANDSELAAILDSRIAAIERDKSLAKIAKMQLPAGGFPWFEGGPPDRYMTLYVLMGFGRALEFKVDVPKEVITKAWGFTRAWLDADLEKMMADDCCWEHITMLNYAVSLYPDESWTGGFFDAPFRKRLLDFSFKHWKHHSPLLKGYLALTLDRMGRKPDAKLVWDSVMDSAKTDSQLGTYWAPEDRSWLWYNDTVETHAFSLRTLMELEPKDKRSDGLVQWLYLNKKMNHWKSTRATGEAIYALVHYLDENKTLAVREVVTVDAGTKKTQFTFEPEVYTGKKSQIVIPGEAMTPSKNSKITIEKETPGIAFASATWHFSTDRLPKEDRGDFFNVTRTYFKREMTNGPSGKEWTLKPLAEGQSIKVGDQIEVQISLRTKHEAEYVHLRDPRAAGLEPENVVSGYRWDLGINWYEETRDSGSNFFFSKLPVGEYTFKYRLRANMAGTFRVGPATVQSFYAPEFNAYSSGYVMKIETSGN